MYQKADALLCIAELEILADGLHLILIDPYNEPKLKVRYPHSATYEEVRHALEDVCVCMCMYSYAVCAHSFSVAYAQTWLRLILKGCIKPTFVHSWYVLCDDCWSLCHGSANECST